MSIRIPQVSIAIVAVLGTTLAIGCGSDDDSGPKTKSFEDISAQIEEPTGVVNSTSVGPVAEQFASMSSASVGGSRAYAQTQTAEQACEAGGNMTASGAGSETSGNVSIDYNNCCYTEGCCYDGIAHVVYSEAGGAAFSYCADYDVDYVCEGQNLSVIYAACMQADGALAYSVEVSGATYTVSGYYSDGNGQLTITGANGSWDCTYTSGSGSCTGTGGDFTF